jgi:hypothetical protein
MKRVVYICLLNILSACSAHYVLTSEGSDVLVFRGTVPYGCIRKGTFRLYTQNWFLYGDTLRDETEILCRNEAGKKRATHILITHENISAHRFDLWGNLYTCNVSMPF